MIVKSMTASALAGGLLMVMLQAPAQALTAVKSNVSQSSAVTLVHKKGSGGGGGGGQKGYGGFKNYNKGNHGHRRFRGFGFYGYPYFYGYSSFGRCDWLYRRAIGTGSPYWWGRYHACRDGYYDY